jgi:hypothetical protein
MEEPAFLQVSVEDMQESASLMQEDVREPSQQK